jgi:hypothetical protein
MSISGADNVSKLLKRRWRLTEAKHAKGGNAITAFDANTAFLK